MRRSPQAVKANRAMAAPSAPAASVVVASVGSLGPGSHDRMSSPARIAPTMPGPSTPRWRKRTVPAAASPDRARPRRTVPRRPSAGMTSDPATPRPRALPASDRPNEKPRLRPTPSGRDVTSRPRSGGEAQ